MPTYDYKCSQCGSVFEKFHYMNDNPEVECPECQGPALKMIGAGAGIVFKGSGFYVNDYKKSSDKSSGSSSKKDGGEKSSSSTTEKSAAPVATEASS